ncbi:MAG: hypothetical protein U0T83_05965 [Bacteriovoracaceae bacterium]
MFDFIRKKKSEKEAKEIAKIVVDESEKSLMKFHKDIINHLEELQAEIKQMSTNIRFLEQKILIKEEHFNKQFGLLHYKINEVPIKNKKYD